jgi:hypothetical protein
MLLRVMFFDQFKAIGGNQYINTRPESHRCGRPGLSEPCPAPGVAIKKGMTHFLDRAF